MQKYSKQGKKSPWKELDKVESHEKGRYVAVERHSIPEASWREPNDGSKEKGRKTGLSSLKKSGTKYDKINSGDHKYKDGGRFKAKYDALKDLSIEMSHASGENRKNNKGSSED